MLASDHMVCAPPCLPACVAVHAQGGGYLETFTWQVVKKGQNIQLWATLSQVPCQTSYRLQKYQVKYKLQQEPSNWSYIIVYLLGSGLRG